MLSIIICYTTSIGSVHVCVCMCCFCIITVTPHSPCAGTPVNAGTPDPGTSEGSSKQLRGFPRNKHKV